MGVAYGRTMYRSRSGAASCNSIGPTLNGSRIGEGITIYWDGNVLRVEEL